MNHWTQLSIQYANQRSYLDDLFRIYPTIPEGIRDIDEDKWNAFEYYFDKRDSLNMVDTLLDFGLFPLKDSYVAYLRHDRSALKRNPNTVARLAGRIYGMGKRKVYERCSEPKETNRQIGPMFKEWLKRAEIGVPVLDLHDFCSTKENAILDAGDEEMKQWGRRYVNYQRNKGLDFVGRFNNKYVIGEAKFLTDFGGHQNAQLNDALETLTDRQTTAVTVAILDGVLYIKNRNKMHASITRDYSEYNILSALVLNEFLFSL